MTYNGYSLLGLIALLILSNCSPEYRMVNTSLFSKQQLKDYKTFGFMVEDSSKKKDFDQLVLESLVYKRFTALGYTYNAENPDMLIGVKYVKLFSDQFKEEPGNSDQVQISTNQLVSNDLENPYNGFLIIAILNPSGRGIFRATCSDYKPGMSLLNTASSICRMLDQYEMVRYDVGRRRF